MSISIPLSVYLSYVYIYIFIYKTPHDVPNQSGVYLGLKDKNQFLYPFVLRTLLLFMIAQKVQCVCCLVFHTIILITFLFVIHVACKMCKSFDRKKCPNKTMIR